MRFRKIILVHPRYPGSHYSGSRNTFLPISLGILAEMLKLSGVDYEIIDLGLGYNREYLFERIKIYQPDAVGISMMTFRYQHMYSLLEKIKEAYSDIKIIAGGPHITAWKTKVLEQCPAIDFGVSREGELTIRQLCEAKDLANIQGLIYRQGDGKIIFNGERELIDNLDIIPFPKYDKFELDKYERTILISSSRGCPYSCIFCQSRSILGNRFRPRSARNIFDEIMFWYNKKFRNFNFVDDNFTLEKDRIYELCRLIKTRHLKSVDFCVSGVRADRVDADLLKLMKDAGFNSLSFGVESASDNILKVLKKQETIEDMQKSIAIANKLGYKVSLYFVVGSPYETLEDIEKSIEFAKKYASGGCNFVSLVPIPDTELMEWVKGHGRLLMEPEYYLNELKGFERLPYFDGPGMSLEEKKQALKLTEKARITISRKFRLASLNENFIEDRKNSGLLKASLLFLLRAVFINSFLFDLYESNRRFKIFCINFKERLRLDK